MQGFDRPGPPICQDASPQIPCRESARAHGIHGVALYKGLDIRLTRRAPAKGEKA